MCVCLKRVLLHSDILDGQRAGCPGGPCACSTHACPWIRIRPLATQVKLPQARKRRRDDGDGDEEMADDGDDDDDDDGQAGPITMDLDEMMAGTAPEEGALAAAMAGLAARLDTSRLSRWVRG